MAYISKRVYGILMAKAKKDRKAGALLNMIKDMPQEEANQQVQMMLFKNSGGTPMTGDYEKAKKEPKRKDRVSMEANKRVDSGEYSDYDDAYNQIARRQSLNGRLDILKQNNLPIEYDSENLLLEMFEGSGFEVKRIDEKTVIVVIEEEEHELPIVRDKDKINFVK